MPQLPPESHKPTRLDRTLQLDGIPYFQCPPLCSGIAAMTSTRDLTATAPDGCINNGGGEHGPLRLMSPTSLGIWLKLSRRWEGSERRSQQTLTIRLGLPSLSGILLLTAVDNRPIGKGYITRQTILFTLQVRTIHFEEPSFYVISSPANPIILGFPWLQLHNPHMSWREGELTRWSPYCLNHCLKNIVSRPCLATSIKSPINAETSTLPWEYHDLRDVFSKERAI
ncbi:hypothetical protein QTP70_025892 [Hemibagrus guttatus]|uniref:Uncharacterized protein n=1 Tax=Hemibagrus guttatus TaxID=175788 RepID=A0AAE0QSP0_9TELE|nr:hypothetical protein QTP70_025892 [Hemibagrus guttatus]KAK3560941.1 hypothetical protein QTP86_023135 [Hemibagrus guttatus]